jgi:hypothetical protein
MCAAELHEEGRNHLARPAPLRAGQVKVHMGRVTGHGRLGAPRYLTWSILGEAPLLLVVGRQPAARPSKHTLTSAKKSTTVCINHKMQRGRQGKHMAFGIGAGGRLCRHSRGYIDERRSAWCNTKTTMAPLVQGPTALPAVLAASSWACQSSRLSTTWTMVANWCESAKRWWQGATLRRRCVLGCRYGRRLGVLGVL